MRSIGRPVATDLNLLKIDFLNAEDAEGFAEGAEENLCVHLRIPLRPLCLSIVCRSSTLIPLVLQEIF
jgi:hypothetical protein